MVRFFNERDREGTGTIFDGRTLQSTSENGERAAYDGPKTKKGPKVVGGVDSLGDLLALRISAADKQERAQLAALAEKLQEVTGARLRSRTSARAMSLSTLCPGTACLGMLGRITGSTGKLAISCSAFVNHL